VSIDGDDRLILVRHIEGDIAEERVVDEVRKVGVHGGLDRRSRDEQLLRHSLPVLRRESREQFKEGRRIRIVYQIRLNVVRVKVLDEGGEEAEVGFGVQSELLPLGLQFE